MGSPEQFPCLLYTTFSQQQVGSPVLVGSRYWCKVFYQSVVQLLLRNTFLFVNIPPLFVCFNQFNRTDFILNTIQLVQTVLWELALSLLQCVDQKFTK